ncbi:MAG: hypothetical protein U0736_11910 [Gemmataceae bacterium]
MRATGVCAAGLLSLHLLTSAALAQCPYYYPPRAPDMKSGGVYLTSNCGVTFGPNYCVRPPFEPFQGMLLGPCAPNGNVPGYCPAGAQCGWQLPPAMWGYPYNGGPTGGYPQGMMAGGYPYPMGGYNPYAMGAGGGMGPAMAGTNPYAMGGYNPYSPSALAALCPPWMLPQGRPNDPMASSLAMSQFASQNAHSALGRTPYVGLGQRPQPMAAGYPQPMPMVYPQPVVPVAPTGLAAMMPPAGWMGMPVPLPARPFVAAQEQEKQRQAPNANGVTAFPNPLYARSPRDFFMVEVDPRQRSRIMD